MLLIYPRSFCFTADVKQPNYNVKGAYQRFTYSPIGKPVAFLLIVIIIAANILIIRTTSTTMIIDYGAVSQTGIFLEISRGWFIF